MFVRHLNCGSMRLVTPDPESADLRPERSVAHCLLIETAEDGLVLVDTGLGSQDVADPERSLGPMFLGRAEPLLELAETAAEQIRSLGYAPSDVRHIVLTHLDLDHAGGLGDFPAAQVHVSEVELRAAAAAPGFHPEDRNRYRPLQWAHHPKWAAFGPERGDTWFGFDSVAQPTGLPEGIRIIPLGGHSAGHVGVAVNADSERWLLHAGDAYYYHGELDVQNPRSVPGLDYLQGITEVDRDRRLGNNARLRELIRKHSTDVEVFCSHDPWEFLRSAASV